MGIKVYKTKISQSELQARAQEDYGDMIKGVVDLEQKVIALGGELHADGEEILLKQGSKQEYLWGFNIYPMKSKEARIQFTSFINIRPKQNNFQIEIKDEALKERIRAVIDSLID